MSDDREMNIAPDERQAARCPKCRMQKMKVDGSWKCINCSTASEPKTGHTIIVTEPNGTRMEDAAHVRFVTDGEAKMAAPVQAQYTPAQIDAEIQRRTNTVLLHIPVSLFPDLVMWARKLKLPKDWKEAEKIKAITDFQVEINKKLEGIAQ